jgi:hypothetical protein
MISDAKFDSTELRRKAAIKAAKPRRRPESEIVAEGIGYIRTLQFAYARKVHGSQFGNAGEPDVDAVVCGRSVKLECKAPDGGKPTAVQMGALRRWQKTGALVGWFTNVGHIQEILDHLNDPYPGFIIDPMHPGCSCERHQNIPA